MILLTRYYTPHGTWGDLEVEGEKFSTIERPWLGNEQSKSCIPSGVYNLELRNSPTVKRINGVNEGWEVKNVQGRKYIMFHSGNWVKDSDGCILLGKYKDIVDNSLFIGKSQEAFDEFMEIMDSRMQWEINIVSFIPEFP